MGFWEDASNFGQFLGHVGTLGIFKVMDNNDRSNNANDQRSTLDNNGKQAWEGDRRIIGDEWSRLLAGTNVTMEGTKVTPEPFSTWPHQQIWEALNGKDGQGGVDVSQVNASADGWRRLTTGTETAVNNYRTKFEQVLSEKWSGASGSAAIDAVKSYTNEAAKLPATFQMVANGVDYMEGVLGQAKIAIPEPEKVSTFDEFISHIPGNGVVKAAKHRANEAEEDARLFMIGTYQPGSITVDKQTPILPVPINNIGDPGGVPDTGDNGNDGGSNNDSNNNGGDSSTDPAGTQEDPATTEPQSTDPAEDQNDDGTGDDSTEPSSTDPSATTPAATTPAGTGTPTTPGGGGAPGSGSPGSGSPGSGVPSGGAQGAAVPGTPGGAAAAAGSGNRVGTTSGVGGRGMSGMPGMMGGGRGGGKGEDDSEHAIPDYLIQDREDELIGLLPPPLPPGGVIGA